MANQIIIDIGAVANDGTGDPLRTAFGYVNNNFSNIWTTGVANSNIAFDGNRLLTTNTNGNLVLAPNGIGKVQANVDIVPNANNTLSLGSLTRQWNTVYAQNLAVGGNVEFNDLTVDGNLTVQGNVIQIGNLVTDAKTIQLANTAGTANAANGSGITVGANDNIATMLYSSTSNVWTTNIGIVATGNITGSYFVGNGSLLTGIASPYGNANVATYLASGTNTSNIVTTNTVIANNINFTNNLYGKTGTFTGDATGDNSIYAGVPLFTSLGSDVIAQFSGNVDAYTQFNFQNGNPGSQASGDYVITADNGNDTTHFINMGITSSTWDGTQTNSLGNRLGPNDGYLYIQDGDMVIGTSNGNIETWKFDQTGNLTVPGDILPLANNTQSLGSATNQWNDLYISNATIFMNGVPISLGAGNILTVNGEAVLSNDSNATITTTGNITADYFFGDGSQLTGLSTDSISNGTSNVEIATANGNVTVTTDGSWTWTFGTDGNLTIPGAIISASTILIDNRASGNTADIQLFSADDILLQARDRTAGSGSEGGDINIYAGDSAEDSDSSGGDIQILAGDGGAGNVDFASTGGFITIRSGQGGAAIGNSGVAAAGGGSLTLQAGSAGDNNGNIDLGANGGDVVITAGLSTGNLNAGGDVQITSGQGGANASAGQIELNVPISDAGPGGTWSFNYTGNLNLPNGGSIIVDGGDGVIGPNGDNMVISWDNEELILRSVAGDVDVEADNGFNIRVNYDSGANDYLTKWVFAQDNEIVNITGNSAIVTEAGNLNLQGGRNTLSSGNVQITAVDNGVAVNTWTFDNTGVLTLPGEGVLQSLDDTVTLRSLNTTTGNANSVYLGSSGGLGFNDQEAGGNWLEIFRNGAEPEIRVPVGRGNLNIQTAEGINAYNWTFDNTGNLTLPGNTFAVNYANGTAVALGSGSSYGDSNVVSLLSSFGSNTISTTGNITAGNISGNISITGNITGTSPNVTLVAGSYSTTFDNTGNVTFANSNVFVGVTNTVLPNTVASFSSNVNSYTQVTNQNRSTGADATADYILTANNGSDSVNYGDFGIINSGYDNATPTNSLGNIVFAADTYVYAAGNVGNTSQSGGNLAIGTITAGKTVKIFAGGNTASAQVANISSTGVAVTGNVVTSNQLQSSAFTGGNISWAANNRVDFQGAIKVGGTGQILSPSGAASITLNSNGANIPILGVTNTGVSTSTTTGALIVSGGTGIAGNVYVGGLGNITGNLTVNGTGGVSTPNLPAFRVYGNGVTSGLTTTINGNGILTGNNWAVDYNQGSYLNSTTGAFTAPVAGLYQVNLTARCANNAAPTAQVMVVKNYGSANITQAMWEVAANTTVNHFGVSTVSKLAVGDTLAVRITVGTINFDENDNWSVAFLG